MKKLISGRPKRVKQIYGNIPIRDYDKNAWFYVDEKGIKFVHWAGGNCYQFLIPWNKLIK